MANQDHLRIIKRGVSIWNEWREHTDLQPDLSKANLSNLDLSRVDLSESNLEEATLNKANLQGADLGGAKLKGAKLRDVDLSGNILSEGKDSYTILNPASLYEADLFGAELSGANLSGANLSKARLCVVDLRGANLKRADFTGANLAGANLSDADLSGSNLSTAILCSNLIHADLTGANLNETNFMAANIGWTKFGNNDLSVARELESVHHSGPSIIGIDTIYRSKGIIPEPFLRGAGVPDDFIVYMRSLTNQALQFYSCFISYSSKDEKFVERLYADLQSNGVRCWFAEEDIKIGDKFRQKIDESIRIHDKLLVVLSKRSVHSPWVEAEVEAALEREQKENRLVLFPIRIDDTVMESNQSWAAELRRTRHIGDFMGWKNHNTYQKSFTRLLRDLKADD